MIIYGTTQVKNTLQWVKKGILSAFRLGVKAMGRDICLQTKGLSVPFRFERCEQLQVAVFEAGEGARSPSVLDTKALILSKDVPIKSLCLTVLCYL